MNHYSDPPQPERPTCAACLYGDDHAHSCAPRRVPAPSGVTEDDEQPDTLDYSAWVLLANVSEGDWTQQAPEWQAAVVRWRERFHASLRDRVPAPEGVTVIGWTEPTDDEPRSLPMIRGLEAVPDGWEALPNPYYVIEPIPSPPVPETESTDPRIEVVARALARKSGPDPDDEWQVWLVEARNVVNALNAAHLARPLDGTDGD